jgi:hypothetical protein
MYQNISKVPVTAVGNKRRIFEDFLGVFAFLKKLEVFTKNFDYL